MATRKFRKIKGRRPIKTARRHRKSTAGKIMPPLDVRSNKHLMDFKKRITKGPLTIVLVYADWCGHCHTMMPHFDAAAKSPKRSIQAVKVNEKMLPAVNEYVSKNINKAAKPLNVEGYPSIILVNNKGEKLSDIEPVRNTQTMTQVMEQSGPLANEAGLNKTEVTNIKRSPQPEEVVENIAENIQSVSTNIKPASMAKNNKNKMLANIGVEEAGLVEGTPVNSFVGEEELKGSLAAANANKNKQNIKLNSIPAASMGNAGQNAPQPVENLKTAKAPSPINSFNSKNNTQAAAPAPAPSKNIEAEAEAITSLAAPVQPPSMSEDVELESISNNLTPAQKIGGGGRRGGSLMEAMARTTYTIAAPAALLATAAYVMRKKKTRKASKKRRSSRRIRR